MAKGKTENNFFEERKKQIADLLEKAKGEDRNYRQYALAAGVSCGAMTRMKNGDYLPKPDTIMKLTSGKAAPRGGVTYEEMMQAAGYAVNSGYGIDVEYAVYEQGKRNCIIEFDGKTESTDNATGAESTNSGKMLSENRTNGSQAIENERILHQEWLKKIEDYAADVTSKIYMALVEKGIMFRKENLPSSGSQRDYVLKLMDQPVANWKFEYLFFRDNRPVRARSILYERFGREIFNPLPDDTKLSYVINDRSAYQYLERFEHATAFRGELSVLLYDMEKKKIVSEFYLSNFREGDRSKELYLVKTV